MRYHVRSVNKNVVVVGGGLAGLAASIYLARAGRSVTLFEKRRSLGGRAITTLRHGYRFNLGPHLFHRAGPGAAVCRELGIPLRGSVAKSRAIALAGGEEYRLPTGWWSLLATSLLSMRGKRELAMAMFRIRRSGGRDVSGTFREWLDRAFTNERAREVMMALARQATFYDECESLSAHATLDHLKIALRRALYIDEGWQKIVDSLHSAAISSGVNFVTSSRIVGVHHDGESVREIELGGLEMDADRMDTQALAMPQQEPESVEGARIPASNVLLAVDPQTAAQLAGDVGSRWADARPVTAACLDVALRSLPQPQNTRALSLDEPMHLGVHSAFAQLTPKGGALIHVARSVRSEAGSLDDTVPRSRAGEMSADERAMEGMLDRLQPGWRDVLVHRRFLPSLTVSNAISTPEAARPSPITGISGLYIAGDWVGDEGMLSDATLASARVAAKAILAAT